MTEEARILWCYCRMGTAPSPQPALQDDYAGVSSALADFDGDGDLDIVDSESNGSHIGVYLNSGDGQFADPVFTTASPALQCIAAGDFNGDGFADVAEADNNEFVSIVIGNGNGTFKAKSTLSAQGPGPSSLAW